MQVSCWSFQDEYMNSKSRANQEPIKSKSIFSINFQSIFPIKISINILSRFCMKKILIEILIPKFTFQINSSEDQNLDCNHSAMLRAMLAPKYCRATDAAPIPSKKLRWSIGRWQMCFLSSCWMRGISGGGVAAVPTPSCPYCHCCLDFPFLPPLPFCFPFGFWWSCALGGGVHCGLDGWACWCHWTGGGGGFHCVCCCHCCTCCVWGLFCIGWYWYGGGLWYGWFWYRRLKRLGRQYCFPFPLPFPPLYGLDSLRGFLGEGCVRMSVSWTVSWITSWLACLKVTPPRICMAICQENVFQAALICWRRSLCLLVRVSNRWIKLLMSTSSPKRMSVHAHLMASRPSKIMSRVCGSHSCLFFSMSVLVSASMVRTVSFVFVCDSVIDTACSCEVSVFGGVLPASLLYSIWI